MNTKTVLAIIAITAAFSLVIASATDTSFANKKNTPQDDKNNPTFPGCGIGSGCQSDEAQENTFENCAKHSGSQSGNVPAQCQ